MRALLTDNKWVYLDQLLGAHEPLIIKKFSARHPKIQFIDTQSQSWDGWYRMYDAKQHRIPRAMLNELIGLCKSNKIPLEIVDYREDDPKPVPSLDEVKPDLLNGITLEPHQIDAIKVALNEEVGLISAPTGSGKTEIMAGITKLYNRPTVIIANQRVVIEQIKERLELRDVSGDGVGLFYGGEMPTGQSVVVGSIQSLTSPPLSLKNKDFQQWKSRYQHAKLFQEIVKKAELLLVDEADTATDNRFKKMFNEYYQGRYRFGFSGTCFDPSKPVEALLLKKNLGSIIYEVSRSYLESIGRIIPIKCYMMAVGPEKKNDRTTFDIAEKECLIENNDYHDAINKLIEKYPNERNLVLVDTNNVEALGTLLESKIANSVFIYGKTPTKKRREAIAAFEQGQLHCLIGGKILKRGLDLKGGVHNLIICGGGKLSSDFNQKVGRAVRQNDRGFSRLFFFLHLNNYYLYRHSREQLKSLITMGYKVKVLVRGNIVDGEELVNSKFRLPKEKKA